jgi:hypothetical protein
VIDPEISASDEECLARPPAVVHLGAGERCAVVVTLSGPGLLRARAGELPAIAALALKHAGCSSAAATAAAAPILRFTTEPQFALPAQVDTLADLDALLGWNDPREAPVLATLSPAANAAHRILYVPPDLAWFEGHFPGEPILAGVVQLRWAIAAARELMGVARGPDSIRQLKFKSPIRPGCVLDLVLSRPDGAAALAFAFKSASGEHSSGRLHY